jgi:hypothetical protein
MKLRVLGLIVLICATAGVANAQKVTTDSAPGAPFGNYRTFAWTPGTPAAVSLTEQRIHAGVNAQLQAKGLTQVAANPDLYVATHVVTQQVPEVIASGFGPVVDLYDASTHKMVWRGVATSTLSSKPSKNSAKLDKALVKMFQKYPPGVASAN